MTDPGDRPPARFGRYTLLGMIGGGAYSAVYRARLEGEYGFRKQVALKILHHRLERFDDPASADFLNEARLGAHVRHPHLVEFYECGRVGDRLYIAMELVDGPDLEQVLRMIPEALPPLDDALIVAIADQLARGLAALHGATDGGRRLGTVHLDLKPGNVLLSPHGQAKLTDYGVARFAADFYEADHPGGARGSPLYMSPEQARGELPGQPSDVFSFGVTVLEMINGAPVFADRSVDAILARVRDADAGDALIAARRRFPELVLVLEGCLPAEPASRIPDGQALVEALREVPVPERAEERVADLSVAAYGLLEVRQRATWDRAVQRFWRPRPGDTGSVSVQLDPIDATVEPPSPTPLRPGPAASRADLRLWSGLIAAAAVVLAATIALAVVRWDGSTSDPPLLRDDLRAPAMDEAVPSATVPRPDLGTPAEAPVTAGADRGADDDTPRAHPSSGGSAGDAARASGPGAAAPDDPTADAADATAPSAAVAAPGGPPRLQHTPVARAIRGASAAFAVDVDPPGAYRATVWYRTGAGEAWQTRQRDGGATGTVTVELPTTTWTDPAIEEVEYFIEVAGPGGLARVGSAVRPYRLRLY